MLADDYDAFCALPFVGGNEYGEWRKGNGLYVRWDDIGGELSLWMPVRANLNVERVLPCTIITQLYAPDGVLVAKLDTRLDD